MEKVVELCEQKLYYAGFCKFIAQPVNRIAP